MQEQLVSFEVAVLAKEVGFDLKTVYHYPNLSKRQQHCLKTNWNSFTDMSGNSDYQSAPTQSLLQKWLREEHGIFVNVDVNIFGKWIYLVFNLNAKRCSEIPEIYETSKNFISSNYEKTMENGIKNALIYLKSKKNAGTTN